MDVRRSALVAYPAESMFDLIEGAEHYPAFMPWCAAATILERDEAIVAARIVVAWHGVKFEIVTRNPKKRPEWLSVRMQHGPFRRFDGDWHIRALSPTACKIEFALCCEFDNALFRGVAGPVLERAAGRVVDAFVARADALYGARVTPLAEPTRPGGADAPPPRPRT